MLKPLLAGSMARPIGIVLSGSTSKKVIAQLYAEYEGKVREGEFCFVHLREHEAKLLGRINRIIPYSDFFEEGDAWSEARRKMVQIPTEISRRFYTLEIEVLGEVWSGSLSEASIPPPPGSEVSRFESEKEVLEIIEFKGEEKALVKFGRLFGCKEVPFFLDLDALPMHMAILGVTGSGKSYTVGYLIEQLSDIKIGSLRTALTTIIIDAHGDYIDYYEAFHYEGSRIGNYKDVIRFVFNKSPERINKGVKVITMDLDVFDARELAELIMVYYTGGSLNELQVAGLEMVLRRLREEGYNFSSLFLEPHDYNKLISELDVARESKLIHEQTLQAIKRALKKFEEDVKHTYELVAYRDVVTFGSQFIDKVTDPKNPCLVLVDFSADGAPGVSLQLKQLVVSYITKLLLKTFTDYKMRGIDRILLLIIEEAQNYCPNLDAYPIGYSLARNNLAQIATQGRKFGLSLCLVSQRPSFVDQVVLSMVNTYIIHRVPAGDVPFIKRVAGGLPEVIEDKLVSLATGRAIITGQMNKLGFPVIVDIPEERKVRPRRGRISVSDILAGKAK